jgi:hypothetical protein
MKKHNLIVLILMLNSLSLLPASEPLAAAGDRSLINMYRYLRRPATYSNAADNLKNSVIRAVKTGAELHDESEFESENQNAYSLQHFKQIKEKTYDLRNKLLKFEAEYQEVDSAYALVSRKLQIFSDKVNSLSKKIFELHMIITNSTTLDEFKKTGLLHRYKMLNDLLAKLQEDVIGQNNLQLGMLKYYDSVIFNKNICEIINQDKLLHNMVKYIADTNQLLDTGLSIKYNNLFDEYTKILEGFVPETKSWYQRIF